MIMSYMVSSLACLVSVSAWGPFAHTYNNTDKSAAFRTGLIAIDAFSHDWFGEKAFRPQMHSFNFTAYLLNKANTTADKDFALGIGCHLAADHVGHDGMGYLSHGLELFVDAWLHRHNNTVIKGSELGFNAGALADETIAQAMGFPPVTIENVNAQWQKFLEYENYEEKIIPYVPDALLGWTSRCKDEPNVMYNEALQGSMQVCEEWLKVNPDDSLEKIMEHGQRVIHIAQGFTPKCGETSGVAFFLFEYLAKVFIWGVKIFEYLVKVFMWGVKFVLMWRKNGVFEKEDVFLWTCISLALFYYWFV